MMLNNMGMLYASKNDFNRAKTYLMKALSILTQLYEPGHQSVELVKMNLENINKEIKAKSGK